MVGRCFLFRLVVRRISSTLDGTYSAKIGFNSWMDTLLPRAMDGVTGIMCSQALISVLAGTVGVTSGTTATGGSLTVTKGGSTVMGVNFGYMLVGSRPHMTTTGGNLRLLAISAYIDRQALSFFSFLLDLGGRGRLLTSISGKCLGLCPTLSSSVPEVERDV